MPPVSSLRAVIDPPGLSRIPEISAIPTEAVPARLSWTEVAESVNEIVTPDAAAHA